MVRPTFSKLEYRAFDGERFEPHEGGVITEAPVSLTVNGEVWLTFMCTPLDLDALAVGFLFNEGVIDSLADVKLVEVCQSKTNVDVWLKGETPQPVDWRRTSGCTGGMTSLDEMPVADVSSNGHPLAAGDIHELMSKFSQAQEIYQQVGGVHSAALSDGHDLLLVCEDIGRHNTLDKLAGRSLLEKVDSERRVLLTTGRISFEMLQKAIRMGADILISRTSPTSLSVELADKAGITLVGYARGRRFSVYTHPERVVASLPETQAQGTNHA